MTQALTKSPRHGGARARGPQSRKRYLSEPVYVWLVDFVCLNGFVVEFKSFTKICEGFRACFPLAGDASLLITGNKPVTIAGDGHRGVGGSSAGRHVHV